jgi:hypothetical protein
VHPNIIKCRYLLNDIRHGRRSKLCTAIELARVVLQTIGEDLTPTWSVSTNKPLAPSEPFRLMLLERLSFPIPSASQGMNGINAHTPSLPNTAWTYLMFAGHHPGHSLQAEHPFKQRRIDESVSSWTDS